MAPIRNKKTYKYKKPYLKRHGLILEAISDNALKNLHAKDDLEGLIADQETYTHQIDNWVSAALSETNKWTDDIKTTAAIEKRKIERAYRLKYLPMKVKVLEDELRALEEKIRLQTEELRALQEELRSQEMEINGLERRLQEQQEQVEQRENARYAFASLAG